MTVPTITAPALQDFVWLAMHMREDERAQWEALTGMPYDADIAARGFANIPGVSFVLLDDEGRAFCAGGFEEIRPRVWQTWMAGTAEGWEQHWRAITKHSRRLMANLFESGRAQRIQTYALASRTAAHEWYRRGLQQQFEATHPCFFADGQAAVCYARTITMHQEAAHGQQS